MPEERRKRVYWNAVLARAELDSTYRPARRLWMRERQGHYVPGGAALLRVNPQRRAQSGARVSRGRLHPHSLDVMRYFAGDVAKVQAFFKRGPRADGPDGRRVCWSNVQANLLFKNGILGHGLHQPLDTLFDGVFEEMPWHLREQQAQMLAEETASGRPWARKK